MFVRHDKHTLAEGREERYVSLAHNVTEVTADGKKRTKPIIFANLGPESKLDTGTVRGMRDALDRYLAKRLAREREAAEGSPAPADAVARASADTRKVSAALRVLGSRDFGWRHLLSRAWEATGIKAVLDSADVAPRAWDFERVVFAMVLHRLVEPDSKLACNDWVANKAWFPEAEGWNVRHMYRALDALMAVWPAMEKQMLSLAVADGDRLWALVDTTSSCFETDLDDKERAALHALLANDGLPPSSPSTDDSDALRLRGHSKDHRPDLPQVVIALLADGTGRPVLHHTFSGNTADPTTTLDMLDRLRTQTDKKLVLVGDGGMTGNPNLRELAARGVDWVTGARSDGQGFGVKLLNGGPGRWAKHPERPGVTWRAKVVPAKQGQTGRDEVWILTRNASEVRRQSVKLDKHIEQVRELLKEDATADDKGTPNNKTLRKPHLRKLVVRSANGTLVLDKEGVAEMRRLLGLHVVRSSLVEMKPLQILASYQRLLKVEDNFRTLKGPIRLRPMYHHRPDRVRAHVMVCFLALVCLRWLERESGLRFSELRDLFGDVRVSDIDLDGHRFWQRDEWSDEAQGVLKKLGIDLGPVMWAAAAQAPRGSKRRKVQETP